MVHRFACLALVFALAVAAAPRPAVAQGDWEITPESEAALKRGLVWLERNQGREGNWESNDLGLVSMGGLAFLAAGHSPGLGPYGRTTQRAIDYVLRNAKPSGLLNISDAQRDMYNHGLSTFVLGQAYGMTADPRISPVLDRALKLIAATQCADGGWDYRAHSAEQGHDLSLVVMQAKALRSAVDSGLEVSPQVIELAIKNVRQHYSPSDGRRDLPEAVQQALPGSFTYAKSGGRATLAMAAAGVVCLQEFGQYEDWRIPKNLAMITARIKQLPRPVERSGQMPVDAYTLYYVSQAIYQVGGPWWRESYPRLRDFLAATQIISPSRPEEDGSWRPAGHVDGKAGTLYSTAAACFVLAIPNRYLPILQEGKIDSLRKTYQGK